MPSIGCVRLSAKVDKSGPLHLLYLWLHAVHEGPNHRTARSRFGPRPLLAGHGVRQCTSIGRSGPTARVWRVNTGTGINRPLADALIDCCHKEIVLRIGHGR